MLCPMKPRSTVWHRPPALPAIALAAFALSACSISDDGPRVTQARNVPPFVRAVNHSSAVVHLSAGGPRRVRVRAGADVIDAVRTSVRGGTLHVTFEHDGLGHSHVVLEVSIPRLTGIVSQGSGDISAAGIDTRGFAVDSDGSADIELAGAADRVTVRSNGSGSVDTMDLRAREVDVSTNGSGDVEVQAEERLDVRLDGSGDVRYLGDPRLDPFDDGSGEIERIR